MLRAATPTSRIAAMSFIPLNPVAPILSIAPKRERRNVILLCAEYRNPGMTASVQRYRDAQRPEWADCRLLAVEF